MSSQRPRRASLSSMFRRARPALAARHLRTPERRQKMAAPPSWRQGLECDGRPPPRAVHGQPLSGAAAMVVVLVQQRTGSPSYGTDRWTAGSACSLLGAARAARRSHILPAPYLHQQMSERTQRWRRPALALRLIASGRKASWQRPVVGYCPDPPPPPWTTCRSPAWAEGSHRGPSCSRSTDMFSPCLAWAP
jgi:hypothetical protein